MATRFCYRERTNEERELAKDIADALATTIHIMCKGIASNRKYAREAEPMSYMQGWNRGLADGKLVAVHTMCCDLRDARAVERNED